MPVPVLVRHDMGCKYARATGDITMDDAGNILTGSIQPAHTDAAKRIADAYNLHKMAGAQVGSWVAVALATGESDGEAYPDKATAVWHQHNSEAWYAFIRLAPCSMSICEAESLLAWHRSMSRLRTTDRDYRRGGMDVIPRLTKAGAARQLVVARQHIETPIGLGYAK